MDTRLIELLLTTKYLPSKSKLIQLAVKAEIVRLTKSLVKEYK